MLSEPEEVKKLMKVPLMDTTQVLLAQMLGTGLQDLSWAKGEGELQPWPRAPSPPGLATADTQWEWQAGLCKASAPHQEWHPALPSYCQVGSLGGCSLPGQCMGAHCRWLSQLAAAPAWHMQSCELGGSLI